jgi:hypothetical protein
VSRPSEEKITDLTIGYAIEWLGQFPIPLDGLLREFQGDFKAISSLQIKNERYFKNN